MAAFGTPGVHSQQVLSTGPSKLKVNRRQFPRTVSTSRSRANRERLPCPSVRGGPATLCENPEHAERQPWFFYHEFLPGRRNHQLFLLFSSCGEKVCAAEQSIAVQLVHTIALDLVRGEQMQAAGEAGEAGEGGREAGTETRLTLNRSNTIETVLSILN